VGAKLGPEKGTINYGSVSENVNVNFTNVIEIAVPESVKAEFKIMITNRSNAFSASNEALPFNTSVFDTI